MPQNVLAFPEFAGTSSGTRMSQILKCDAGQTNLWKKTVEPVCRVSDEILPVSGSSPESGLGDRGLRAPNMPCGRSRVSTALHQDIVILCTLSCTGTSGRG